MDLLRGPLANVGDRYAELASESIKR